MSLWCSVMSRVRRGRRGVGRSSGAGRLVIRNGATWNPVAGVRDVARPVARPEGSPDAGVPLEGLLLSSPVAMFLLNRDDVVDQANVAFAELIGVPEPTGILGMPFREFWHGGDEDACAEVLTWLHTGASDRLRTVCRWRVAGECVESAIWVRLHLSTTTHSDRELVLGVVEECSEEMWETGLVEFD